MSDVVIASFEELERAEKENRGINFVWPNEGKFVNNFWKFYQENKITSGIIIESKEVKSVLNIYYTFMPDHQKKFKKLIEKNRVDFLLIWAIIFLIVSFNRLKEQEKKSKGLRNLVVLQNMNIRNFLCFLIKSKNVFLTKFLIMSAYFRDQFEAFIETNGYSGKLFNRIEVACSSCNCLQLISYEKFLKCLKETLAYIISYRCQDCCNSNRVC